MDNSLKDSQIKLMQSVAGGNRLAFEQLYRQTSPYLFTIALRMLRNRSWAEEVLHDSFLTVWNRSVDYDSTLSAPVTWLTHIVRNRCIDGLRSRQGRNGEREEEFDEQLHQDANENSADGYGTDSADKLHECLGHLDAAQRQSVVLAYYQGMSHSEIAEWLQQPLGTVKSWVRRALDHLKDCVGL